jgi:hypothetical protein
MSNADDRAVAAGDDPEPPDLRIPATPADAINFALGVMDMMCVLAATLIGRGMLEPNAFHADLNKRAELDCRMGNPSRAAAAELFGQRLKNIERAKLMATNSWSPTRIRGSTDGQQYAGANRMEG